MPPSLLGDLSIPQLIGILIGSLAGIALLTTFTYFLLKRRSLRRQIEEREVVVTASAYRTKSVGMNSMESSNNYNSNCSPGGGNISGGSRGESNVSEIPVELNPYNYRMRPELEGCATKEKRWSWWRGGRKDDDEKKMDVVEERRDGGERVVHELDARPLSGEVRVALKETV